MSPNNLQEPQGASRPNAGQRNSIFLAIAVVIIIALGIVAYLFWSQVAGMNRQMANLRKQMAGNNQKMAQAEQSSNAALERAIQAQQSAVHAAQERDAAQQAKAKSDQQAQQALQQVQVAQQKTVAAQQQAAAAQQAATAAEQKAEQYRQEREAEIDHLQQVLGQIADTRRTSVGLVMTLGSKSIKFAFDQSSLRPDDRELLSRIAGILSTLKGFQIYVYGYTDQIGPKDYNQKLSEKRAVSVRNYLVANGINASIISTKGFGEADPIAAGMSAQDRAKNRRVEIGIVDSTIRPVAVQDQPAP